MIHIYRSREFDTTYYIYNVHIYCQRHVLQSRYHSVFYLRLPTGKPILISASINHCSLFHTPVLAPVEELSKALSYQAHIQ